MEKKDWPMTVLVAVIAAGVTMLLTPKSGKEARQDIKDKVMDTKDAVKTEANQLKEDFKESYFEAEREVELELAHLNERQRELRATIASIEEELNH